jgi:5-methylcytosine-specific restriction endonuclease McrA
MSERLQKLSRKMLYNQLSIKEVRECKDYQKRVLFFDPKPIYDRIKINPYLRVQGVSITEMFPNIENTCACGCGAKLEGKKKRWANDECKYFAQAIWAIINGYSEVISSYLKLYHGVVACIECGLTDEYKMMKNGLSYSAIHKDHIIPVHKGGGGCWLSNYQYLCEEHHKIKTKNDLKK